MKNNEFKVSGVIYSIAPDITNSAGTFKWTEVIIAVMGGKYTEYLLMQATDDNNIAALRKYKPNDRVDILFRISGRLVNRDDREVVYNNNQIINISKQ